MKLIIERLKNAFNLTSDLIQNLSEDNYKLKLKNLPSNTIGQQVWCIVGARESYLKAIVNNGWAGFSCSLNNTTSKDDVLQCLQKSSSECMNFLDNHELNEHQTELLLTLLEHETQHHGQLIRYIYGNKLSFPKSWNKRYSV